MKVTIIGIRKAKTKNGREFCSYFYEKAFTDYERENSDCLGMTVGSEFSYKDYNLKPGDVCDFMYEPGFEGKATLSDVVVLKPNDASGESAKETKK